MTDNEIILALSNIIEPVKTEIQEIRKEIQGLKEENKEIRKEIQGIKGEIRQINGKIACMDQRLQKIEVVQEIEILPRLKTIEDCYISTFDRYRDSVDTYDTMKQDIAILKDVVTEHSTKLHKIS